MGEGATASSGPSSLEEEHKKVSILEDSVKTSDEQLQWIRQEKANLERELGEERVAKNCLEAEKARLAAELQAVPDDTVWTAQITELQKELQHVQSEKENLHREVCRLKHERDRAVLPSQNAHILREKEHALHQLQVALKVSKKGNPAWEGGWLVVLAIPLASAPFKEARPESAEPGEYVMPSSACNRMASLISS